MKQYKKIDLYENGKYICSTTQHKTCKSALESMHKADHKYTGKNKLTAHFATK
jgi:hypothetical protein